MVQSPSAANFTNQWQRVSCEHLGKERGIQCNFQWQWNQDPPPPPPRAKKAPSARCPPPQKKRERERERGGGERERRASTLAIACLNIRISTAGHMGGNHPRCVIRPADLCNWTLCVSSGHPGSLSATLLRESASFCHVGLVILNWINKAANRTTAACLNTAVWHIVFFSYEGSWPMGNGWLLIQLSSWWYLWLKKKKPTKNMHSTPSLKSFLKVAFDLWVWNSSNTCLIEISLPVSVRCTDLFHILFLLVFVLLCPLRDIWVTAAARAALPIPLGVCSIFVCPNNIYYTCMYHMVASVWDFAEQMPRCWCTQLHMRAVRIP